MNWASRTLGEISDAIGGIIQTGPFGSQLHESDYAAEGVPVVMPADIVDGKISERRIARVPEGCADRLARHRLSVGDIVYGRRGDIGRQALVRAGNEGWLCGTGCLRVSLGRDVILPKFLHYYLSLPQVIGWIEGQAVGATMPNLNTGILRRVPVRFPERISVQEKIVAILSAYDDLIDNNRRRIALLEKMAEELYREWFVRLRFPGHERASLVKGLPQGWRSVQLREVADVNKRSLNGRNAPEMIRYVDISSVSTNRIESIEELRFADAPGRARRVLRHGDILWSSVRPGNRAYCLVLDPSENLVASTGFAVISARQGVPFVYLHQAITTDSFVDQMVAVAKGAAYPATSFEDFERAEVLLPDQELLDKFRELCEPIVLQAHQLSKQCAVLARIRDMLLPRLISGKLSIENLDIQFPPSMRDAPAPEETADAV